MAGIPRKIYTLYISTEKRSLSLLSHLTTYNVSFIKKEHQTKPSPILDYRTKLTLCLLMVSADKLCKKFGLTSGLQQNVRPDGSKPVGIPERIYPARLKSLYIYSGLKLKSSPTSILCVCKQPRLWRVCASAQTQLSLGYLKNVISTKIMCAGSLEPFLKLVYRKILKRKYKTSLILLNLR